MATSSVIPFISDALRKWHGDWENTGLSQNASTFNSGGDFIGRCHGLVSSTLDLAQLTKRSSSSIDSIDRGQFAVAMSSGVLGLSRSFFDLVDVFTGSIFFDKSTEKQAATFDTQEVKKHKFSSPLTVFTRFTLVAGRAISGVLFLSSPSIKAFNANKHTERLSIANHAIWGVASALCLVGALDEVRTDPTHRESTLTAKIVNVARSILDCLSWIMGMSYHFFRHTGMGIAVAVCDIITSGAWIFSLLMPCKDPKDLDTKFANI